ncbi:MAG: hypothetical protein AVDCRST_MAG87-2836, partial [uncultured Thermomicrobiales bacterium]
DTHRGSPSLAGILSPADGDITRIGTARAGSAGWASRNGRGRARGDGDARRDGRDAGGHRDRVADRFAGGCAVAGAADGHLLVDAGRLRQPGEDAAAHRADRPADSRRRIRRAGVRPTNGRGPPRNVGTR